MTAVIYARYSSDSQREASIEGQLRDCKDYAEKNGITVVGTYIDRAYSAKTDDRPDFQRMIKDSGKKIFDVVLVWKLDRFARNRFDAVNYKYQLEKNGVHLVSCLLYTSSFSCVSANGQIQVKYTAFCRSAQDICIYFVRFAINTPLYWAVNFTIHVWAIYLPNSSA